MTDTPAQSLEAQYAQSIEEERAALRALQALATGTEAHTRAWQAWSEAISRTNRAWRQLNGQALSKNPGGPLSGRAAVPGVAAPSR